MAAVKQYRPVAQAWKSRPTVEGAGVALRRAFGFHNPGQFDPFLLLDDFRSDRRADYIQGFPWHPHRGIETITYVLDGDVEHGDSLGNQGVIRSGDIQWMTAGSGIIHQEMPKGDAKGRMYGFQLWSNLPKGSKMMDPRYREVKQGAIPKVKTGEGALVRVIAGKVDGVEGPVRDVLSDPEYLDVELKPGTRFEHAVRADHTVFAYAFDGEAHVDAAFGAGTGEALGDGWVVLFGPGDTVALRTEAKPARFLLVSAKPLKEPIAWYGPIVMNTQAELRAAFEEFESGDFVKVGRKGA